MEWTEIQKEFNKINETIKNKFITTDIVRSDLNKIESITLNYMLKQTNRLDGILKTNINNNLRKFVKGKMNTLLDELNKLDSFEKVESVLNKYNDIWLKTESNIVKDNVNEALKYSDWQSSENVDEWGIEWQTSEDEKVRDEHKELNGMVKPINDPFWINYGMPGTAYGCRCVAKRVKLDRVDSKKLNKKPPNSIFNEKEQIGNVFKGEIFTSKHTFIKNS